MKRYQLNKQKKVIKGNIPNNYLNEVMITHSIIDYNSDKEFEEVQQELMLIIKLKDEKPIKINTLKKLKDDNKPNSKEVKVTKVIDKNKKVFV